jgi:hypothetical protein
MAEQLTPAAQAVRDAFFNESDDFMASIAAVLRAAADHLGSCNASTELLALATELDPTP